MFQTNSRGGLGLHRFLILFFLYFVQGIPYGLQTRYLPILFRVNGMDLAQVGLFKLLMMPWLFKPLWALLVDNYFTRKFWLNASLLTLCLLCMITSFVPPVQVLQLSCLMFLFNIVTSVQDIALDSVVIESLTPMQLSHGNIAQVVGYKSGGLFSGGIFSLLSDIVNWNNIFFTLSAIYVLGFITSALFLKEEGHAEQGSSGSRARSNQELSVSREVDTNSLQTGSSTQVNCYVLSLFKTEGTMWMIIFTMFYKVGEMGATNMYPMFMLDNGISPHMTGFWTGFAGQLFSVLGSVLGGLMDPRDLFFSLKFHIVVRGVLISVMFFGILLWESFGTLSYAFSVLALQGVFLTGGAVTTITYTLAMSLSQKVSRRCRASHYTVITTSDVLGRLLFAPVTAWATELLGYPTVFCLFAIVSFLISVLLLFSPTIVKNH